MERALQKLARQLNQYDAASLASLWDNYANLVKHFEPTKRWEEAALTFCMIQAVHWKNQLFNFGVRQSAKYLEEMDKESKRELLNKLKIPTESGKKEAEAETGKSAPAQDKKQEHSVGGGTEKKKRCKVLFFPVRHSDKP
ncbi:MAG: hypothetical protein LBM00_07995 [Deltaproteobacteria bacterium]|jgi:hypothetical protein|nr:hypothetical protein [Deltaproteobacteria bacterium]